MRRIYKRGFGVVLAAAMATGNVAGYATEATKDGSGAAGISAETALEKVDGSQFEGEEWYDQNATFQVNREKAHTSFTSFASVEDAKERDADKAPFKQLLNGAWKFEFADNPAGRNTEFYKNEYDVSGWDEITVPSNWQTEGYDYPKYTDTRLPWEGVETPGAGSRTGKI